eukprot:gene10181-7132_t
MPTAHKQPPPAGCMRLTLVGSGAATGVPVVGHFGGGCACEDAVAHPDGPHARNVAALLITFRTPGDEAAEAAAPPAAAPQTGAKSSHADFTSPMLNTLHGVKVHHALVDCGKTFRDAYFRVLTSENLRSVDALFLTSGKPSAMSGVDDLRDLQSMSSAGGEWHIHRYIPSYMLPQTRAALGGAVPYIVRNSLDMGPSQDSREGHEAAWEAAKVRRAAESHRAWNNIGIRRSTSLQLITVPTASPARIYVPPFGDTPVYAVPVSSGSSGAELSLGLVFGRGTRFKGEPGPRSGSCVAYLSDVASLPVAALAFLHRLEAIDLLIVDCLHGPGRSDPAHLCMDQAADLAARLRPQRVVTTGMSCDLFQDEALPALEAAMAERLPSGSAVAVSIGYDGLDMVLPL